MAVALLGTIAIDPLLSVVIAIVYGRFLTVIS
jgi:hypothetical protein